MKIHLDDQAREEGMDDFRYPPVGEEGWLIATSSDEATDLVMKHGMPERMQLDCDLGLDSNGEPDTSMRFVKWLYERYPDQMPVWNIHSRNGEAAKNLQSFLEGWAKSIDSSDCPADCFHETCIEKFLPDPSGAQYASDDQPDHPDCGDPNCYNCNEASGFPDAGKRG